MRYAVLSPDLYRNAAFRSNRLQPDLWDNLRSDSRSPERITGVPSENARDWEEMMVVARGLTNTTSSCSNVIAVGINQDALYLGFTDKLTPSSLLSVFVFNYL